MQDELYFANLSLIHQVKLLLASSTVTKYEKSTDKECNILPKYGRNRIISHCLPHIIHHKVGHQLSNCCGEPTKYLNKKYEIQGSPQWRRDF